MRFNLTTLVPSAALAAVLAMPAAAITIDTNQPPRTIACDRQLNLASFAFSTSTTGGEFGVPFIIEQCADEARTLGFRGDVGVEYGLAFDGETIEGTFAEPFEYLTIGLSELGSGFDLSLAFSDPFRVTIGLFSDDTLQQVNSSSLVEVAAVPLPAGLPLLLAAMFGMAALRRRADAI